MDDKNRANHIHQNDILTALRSRYLYLEGVGDAFTFALRTHRSFDGDKLILNEQLRPDEELRASIQERENQLTMILPGGGNYSQVYEAGYLGGLNFVLFMSSVDEQVSIRLPGTGGNYVRAASIVHRQAIYNGGRREGLEFVINAEGDPTVLEEEIQEVKERLAKNEGPMGLGASPRIYKEGWLAGLLEAVEIIKRFKGEN